MSEMERPTFRENLGYWWARRRGRGAELADAMYEWDEVGMYSIHHSGMPTYLPHKILFGFGALFWIFTYALSEKVVLGEILFDVSFTLEMLDGLKALSNVILAGGVLTMMYMFVDSHKGTFPRFIIQLEPVKVRRLFSRDEVSTVLRVNGAWEIWPPVGKVAEYVRDRLVLADAIKKEDEKEGPPERKDALDLLMEAGE